MAIVTSTPAALLALKQYPVLWQQAEAGLNRQAARIAERTEHSIHRSALLDTLDQAIASLDGGLIRLEGAPGSGVTSLLCSLLVSKPAVFWLQDDDAEQGLEALCAQLIALEHLNVPLVPPAARSDSRVLEQLLKEAAQHHTADDPLLLIIDASSDADQPADPRPPILPTWLPPHVIMIYGCTPNAVAPLAVAACIRLHDVRDDATLHALVDEIHSSETREALVARSEGNPLYIRFAQGMLQRGALTSITLPQGLDKLYEFWWSQLDGQGRQLALLLAGASEPLPRYLCTDLLNADPHPLLAEWEGMIEYGTASGEEETDTIAYYHPSTRAFLARFAGHELARSHAAVVAFTQDRGGVNDQNAGIGSVPLDRYLLRQYVRHAALSTPPIRTHVLSSVTNRAWIRLQQRRGSALNAASDAAWDLRIAASERSLVRLIRSTFLAGSLASLARALPPDAPAETLLAALALPERDAVLKRILELCDQLPDGRDKAHTLRRLGEVCYAERGMRTTAMRLLAQALDMEAQEPPRSWHDERDQVLIAFARAALEHGAWQESLTISARITHLEQRGNVETEITRWLLSVKDVDHAEVVAHGIVHDNLRVWAQAEVAVGRSRAGDEEGATALLNALPLPTAYAWAQIELACDLARTDEQKARERIAHLPNETQRDRGRALLAHALAEADKDGDALTVAEQIHDVAICVTALLDLRLTLEGLVAMLAVEQATAAISALIGDDRVPLITALAAAHAALGRRERAIAIATQLTEDEERSRALARIAVALAEGGEHTQAQEVITLLTDDDDHDWALDELTRIFTHAKQWDKAHMTSQQIHDNDQRARANAELVIEQARNGDVFHAHAAALKIEVATERARALTAIVPSLIEAGGIPQALALQELFTTPDARSRYQTALIDALARQSATYQGKAQLSALIQARTLALTIGRPLDRVRALLSLAHNALIVQPSLARVCLGLAMRTGAASRSEAIRSLELAAPVFVAFGGPQLLVEASEAIEAIDSWLSQ